MRWQTELVGLSWFEKEHEELAMLGCRYSLLSCKKPRELRANIFSFTIDSIEINLAFTSPLCDRKCYLISKQFSS